MANKRFHKSDALLYQYNRIEYPFDPKNLIYARSMVQLHASPEVIWKDISNEIHTLCKSKDISGLQYKVLTTIMVDCEDFVVGLSLQGAMNIIRSLAEKTGSAKNVPYEYMYFETVDNFAKEMVAYRDFLDYQKLSHSPKKTLADFWPK